MNITKEQFSEMQERLSKGRKLADRLKEAREILAENPEWKPAQERVQEAEKAIRKAAPKRIRQNNKPLMNKLESEFYETIRYEYPNHPRPRPQAKRYKLANGAWYKPDFTSSSWPFDCAESKETAWEVKGPRKVKGVAKGLLALKCAAQMWPEVRFILVWKEEGNWHTQEVISDTINTAYGEQAFNPNA